MTPRARRLVWLASIAVLLLFAGRWTAEFVATRWWAAAVSPHAEAFLTKWMLLGLGLDLVAITIAAAWFAAQAILVGRVIATVQVERQVGVERVRERVPTRVLLLGGLTLGLLLGVITGAGARAWRAPLALAWQGLRFDVPDPLLGRDLGLYVAHLPLWEAAHAFALMLVLLGLALAGSLYLAIRAIERRPGELFLHPSARRHLGVLLALLALVLALGSVLTPYQLAASVDPPLGLLASRTRIIAANALAGGAIGVAFMSLAWAVRARHSLLAAGWIVLAIGAGLERYLIPAFAAEGSGSPTREEDLRAIQTTLWGLRFAEPVTADTLPPITAHWDPAALARMARATGISPLLITPVTLADSAGAAVPGWLMAGAATAAPAHLDIVAFTEGMARADGQPVERSRITIRDARVKPDGPAWVPVGEGGVRVGGLLRRAALSWARQAPTMLRVAPAHGVDWHLDPVTRVRALLPMLSWRLTGAAAVNERPIWLLTGFALVDQAPLMVPRSWGGQSVAAAAPAIVAAIDIGTGRVSLAIDPAAGPLGAAWARFAGPMVSAELPEPVRAVLPYPVEWFEGQLAVLDGAEWGIGRRPGRRVADGPPEPPTATWDRTGPALQAVFEDPARRLVSAVVTGRRRAGVPELVIDRLEGSAAENGRELERRWGRGLVLGRLRDSVRAAGDSLVAGPVRWHLGPAGLAAWMTHITEGRRADPELLWVATAQGTALGGGPTAAMAWGATPGSGAPDPVMAGEADAVHRVRAIREWVRRADSALARGDVTAFGRAWEALRGLLVEDETP